MEQQEIIDGNRIIAQFMGGVYKEILISFQPYMGDAWFFDKETLIKFNQRGIYPFYFSDSALRFNENWNWLMPVAEAIENDGKYSCIISNRGCRICSNNDAAKFDFFIIENSKIEAVYVAIIEFIKWYNQQKNIVVK